MESKHLPLGYEPNEIPLLQPAIILLYIQSGVPGEIRTLDQWIKSPLLYRLSYEYMAHSEGLEPSTHGLTVHRSNQLNYEC